MINDINPFAEADETKQRLNDLEDELAAQKKIINMLFECVGLLMRAENIRIDRKIKPQ